MPCEQRQHARPAVCIRVPLFRSVLFPIAFETSVLEIETASSVGRRESKLDFGRGPAVGRNHPLDHHAPRWLPGKHLSVCLHNPVGADLLELAAETRLEDEGLYRSSTVVGLVWPPFRDPAREQLERLRWLKRHFDR